MKPTITRRGLLLTLGVLLMAGGSAGYAYAERGQPARQVTVIPHCPAEDSCAADYHDGAWHITPATPDANRITGTTRQPTCQELAAEYGDDQLCATGQ